MNEIIKNIESAQLKAEVPQFRVGDTVRVHALIKEGTRERVQIFEGTVLKRQSHTKDRTSKGYCNKMLCIQLKRDFFKVGKTYCVDNKAHERFCKEILTDKNDTPAMRNGRNTSSTHNDRLYPVSLLIIMAIPAVP